MGWDQSFTSFGLKPHNFNPPIPCGMGLHCVHLSSLPFHHFNPPIPCGMGQAFRLVLALGRSISIHPSRVGWDDKPVQSRVDVIEFQSTHPVWDGTLPGLYRLPQGNISIHPSRVGWDIVDVLCGIRKRGISIHPSRVGWDAI